MYSVLGCDYAKEGHHACGIRTLRHGEILECMGPFWSGRMCYTFLPPAPRRTADAATTPHTQRCCHHARTGKGPAKNGRPRDPLVSTKRQLPRMQWLLQNLAQRAG